MGKPFFEWLGDDCVYSCARCHCHLAKRSSLVSKQFHARTGRAYLFETVSNVLTGEKEERAMTTGMHQVSDIFCLGCGTTVGWRYWRASENSQKYKENKMILERALIVRSDEGKNGGQAMETVARTNWTSTRLILPLPSHPIPVISFPTPNEVPSDSGDEDF